VARSTKKGGVLDTGVAVLPKLPRDAGDRNRTSPFAFTGNKFEFRAVSSSQNVALPSICLNVAVTEALDHVATQLERAVAGGQALEDAVKGLLISLVKAHKRIVFNGNGYSDEWREEAARRGLLNLRDTVAALPEMIAPDALAAFGTYKVMNEREVRARYDVAVEAYNKTVNVEAQLMTLMANRYILPAALAYQTRVAQNVAAVTAAGGSAAGGRSTLQTLCALVDDFRAETDALARALEHNGGTPEEHAKYFRDEVIPRMARLRDLGDRIEVAVPSDLWPLPTYREMLFIK
jgi:glutamine synthetase